MPRSYIAGGTISPAVFVAVDTTSGETFQVIEATANLKIIGISQEGSRRAPGLGFTNGDEAAIDTEQLTVFVDGDECLLTLGSGGCTQFDYLKSDGSGGGVVAATTGTTVQHIGARALQSGSAGEKVRVEVKTFPFLPAVA